MTEKRFYTDGQYVMQDGEVYVICNGEHNADVVATALNELLTENEQLKNEAYDWKASAEDYLKLGQSLKKENEQLKQAYQTLKHRHSLLHDECLETECDRNSLKNDVISLEKENEQLKETIKELELETAKHIGDGEWDIRDITYCHGKFRLEEWGERYHQFYNGDKQLEDEEVVSLLFENEQLKERIKSLEREVQELSCGEADWLIEEML